MLSRQDVAERICAGQHLIVFHDLLLRIPNSWLQAHPGGSLALLHFVGRDATDEILAYHSEHTLTQVKRFAIARLDLPDGLWQPFLPPIVSGWVQNLSNHQWLRENSLLDNDPAPTLDTLSPPPSTLSLPAQAQHAQYRSRRRRP